MMPRAAAWQVAIVAAAHSAIDVVVAEGRTGGFARRPIGDGNVSTRRAAPCSHMRIG